MAKIRNEAHVTKPPQRGHNFKVAASCVPRHSVHGYAQVHASIYIYIYYIWCDFFVCVFGNVEMLQDILLKVVIVVTYLSKIPFKFPFKITI